MYCSPPPTHVLITVYPVDEKRYLSIGSQPPVVKFGPMGLLTAYLDCSCVSAMQMCDNITPEGVREAAGVADKQEIKILYIGLSKVLSESTRVWLPSRDWKKR